MFSLNHHLKPDKEEEEFKLNRDDARTVDVRENEGDVALMMMQPDDRIEIRTDHHRTPSTRWLSCSFLAATARHSPSQAIDEETHLSFTFADIFTGTRSCPYPMNHRTAYHMECGYDSFASVRDRGM